MPFQVYIRQFVMMRRLGMLSISKAVVVAVIATIANNERNAAWAIDYRVDPTGANGAYTTIAAAIGAISGQTVNSRANILIAPGTYNETLQVNKPYVTFAGLGNSPASVNIVGGSTGLSPGVYVQSGATGFMATNMTFENPLADNVSQGLAIRTSADKSAFDNVRFIGYQDTLLADNITRQYYRNCFITGDTDFIYGNATAVFDHVTVQSTDGGFITAAATEKTTANGFVFLDSTLIKGTARTAVNPASAKTNTVALGRPWQWEFGKMPSAIFIRTKMDTHIRTDGWDPWNHPEANNPNANPDATSRYSEFGSMDLNGNPLPIDASGLPVGRVSWEDPMTAAQAAQYTLANVFGPVAFWNNNPGAQPEGTGVTYVAIGDQLAWDPVAQLSLLPSVPEPTSSALLAVGLAYSALHRRSSPRTISH
ncbi:MAG: pectin esterase [Phycisphaerales bacterium]|nr:pectin esterase [Phycisphaerales bacterium]